MINRIETIFSEVTGKKDISITPKTKLNESLGISSLGLIQLICAIEDEFDVEIPNSVIKKFKTVGDVVSFIEENTNS